MNDWAKELKDIIDTFSEKVENTVKEASKEVAEMAAGELRATSPRRPGKGKHYATGWAVKQSKKGLGKVVYNKDKYQLTHLLEYGHAKRGGNGRVKAIPHIKSVEEKYCKEYVKVIRGKIER